MKKFLKLLSYSTIVLLLSVVAFVACQKDNVDTSSNNISKNTITAQALAEDIIFKEYVIAHNELQAKFAFLDKTKTRDERKKIIAEFDRVGLILKEKGKDSPLAEQEKAAKLFGFNDISAMNDAMKDLGYKRNKLVEKFPFFANIEQPQNNALIKEAYKLSNRYLPNMVIYTKKDGAHILNKVAWRSSLNNLSTLQLRCCPSPWDQDCDGNGVPECGATDCGNGNPCEEAAMNTLQAAYNVCDFAFAAATFACGLGCFAFIECPPCAYGCFAACELLAGGGFGACLDYGTAQYEQAIIDCN